MSKFMQGILRAGFWRDEGGATAIEYGMIAALIVVTIIGAIQALGQAVFNNLYGQLVGVFG